MVHLIFHLPLSFGFWVGETGGVFEASKGALVLLGAGMGRLVMRRGLIMKLALRLTLGEEGTVVGRQWLACGEGNPDSTGHHTSVFTTFSTPWVSM